MTLSVAEFSFVQELVLKRSAIVLEPGKEYLVESRLLPLARQRGFATLADLLAGLKTQASGELQNKVVEAMTTNETSFFRDAAPWDVLRTTVLPKLIAERGRERALSFWCAAASSGQEPYTIAIVLREHFPQLASWTINFIATDLSSEILARAKAGRYSQLEVNRGMPAGLLGRWFRKAGAEWEVVDDIKKMVTFRELNLIESWPTMPSLDVVFLRNVLIYFDPRTKRQILERVRGRLRPDGYLFLGGAETTVNLDPNFERQPFERCGLFALKKN